MKSCWSNEFDPIVFCKGLWAIDHRPGSFALFEKWGGSCQRLPPQRYVPVRLAWQCSRHHCRPCTVVWRRV